MSRSLVVVMLALGVACKQPDREHTKVTTASEYDATQGFVDEEYRFKVTSPGPGWKVLRESDARHINADAVAGVSAEGVQALAIVEAMPDVTLDGFADLIVGNMPLEDKQDEREKTTVGGIAAVRIKVSGRYNDIQLIFRGVLLVHQQYAYQFLAYTTEGQGSVAQLDRAVAAFSIVPGKVIGRKANVVVEDQIGVGWRIAGGVFESAASGLRVKPPAGWRLMAADELQNTNADAEIGLAGNDINMYLAVITEPIAGSNAKTYVADRLRATLETLTAVDDEPAPRVKVLGHDIDMMRARMNDVPIEYLMGIVVHEQRAYQLTGWYPTAQRKTATPKLLAAMASLELLPKDAAAKLATTLAAERDQQNVVGGTFAMRGGTFYDFTHHVRWRKPSGFWKIQGGQVARAANSDALLGAEDVMTGVFTQVIVEPKGRFSDDSYHATVAGGLEEDGFEPERRGSALIAGRPAKFVEGKLPQDGLSLRYRLTTAVIDDIAIQVQIWSVQGVWPNDARLAEITAALQLAKHERETSDDATGFRDNRLGYSLALPAAWRRKDIAPSSMRPMASAHQWTKGDQQVLAIAVYTFETRDEQWLLDLIEQTFRQKIAALGSSKPTTKPGRLGGQPARHVVWNNRGTRVDALLLKRDSTFYAVMMINENGSTATHDVATSAFRLLP